MIVKIDGTDFEIPDKDVIDYVAEMQDDDVEIVPPNKYIFGVNVTHTGELAKAGKDIRNFIDTIGDGEIEVQVSINAKLNEFKDKVVGFNVEHLEPAIGDVQPTDYDEDDYDDYDDYPEEDKLK